MVLLKVTKKEKVFLTNFVWELLCNLTIIHLSVGLFLSKSISWKLLICKKKHEQKYYNVILYTKLRRKKNSPTQMLQAVT